VATVITNALRSTPPGRMQRAAEPLHAYPAVDATVQTDGQKHRNLAIDRVLYASSQSAVLTGIVEFKASDAK